MSEQYNLVLSTETTWTARDARIIVLAIYDIDRRVFAVRRELVIEVQAWDHHAVNGAIRRNVADPAVP
jgi:hypothetical protein